jgi:hypothetical protein
MSTHAYAIRADWTVCGWTSGPNGDRHGELVRHNKTGVYRIRLSSYYSSVPRIWAEREAARLARAESMAPRAKIEDSPPPAPTLDDREPWTTPRQAYRRAHDGLTWTRVMGDDYAIPPEWRGPTGHVYSRGTQTFVDLDAELADGHMVPVGLRVPGCSERAHG